MWIPSTALVLSLLLAAGTCTRAQETPEVLPKVVQHAQPTYPPLARQAHIQGEVRVKITTDGELVLGAEAGPGHPLLQRAAEDNARTWKFARHTPGTFDVTFRYRILSGDVDVKFLELPATVEIEASPPKAIIDYAWIGLGTWKARLKSVRGKSWRMLKLAYSGPDADWLTGDASGPKGESEEIDFGHREGGFLAFTISLSYPGGKHVKTFFIGKMIGDRLVGTFVDDTGVRGEWTAVRVADSVNSR